MKSSDILLFSYLFSLIAAVMTATCRKCCLDVFPPNAPPVLLMRNVTCVGLNLSAAARAILVFSGNCVTESMMILPPSSGVTSAPTFSM